MKHVFCRRVANLLCLFLHTLTCISVVQAEPSQPGVQPMLHSQPANTPVIIAHRGASGYLPEHTMEATVMAFMMGVDFIEQDLVATKDGQLVVLHDVHIDTVTNVADVFPNRIRKDGRFYAVDFTLEELRQLNIHERRALDGSQVYTERYQGKAAFTIATFKDMLELINELNRQFNRHVGWYPEIKAPEWHRRQGIDISKLFVEQLTAANLNHEDARVFVQCFDFNEVKRLKNALNLKAPLIQLIGENSWGESTTDYDYLKTQDGIDELKQYVQGVGPWIPQLVDADTLNTSAFAIRAVEAQLEIHPYTFRADQPFSNLSSEQLLTLLFSQVGVTGLFSDHPDVALEFIKQR